jgi:predicted nucleic acid-binding protein
VIADRVLIDTGPIVALLREDDLAHDDCAELVRELPLPLITCWAVLAEAAWLLRTIHDGLPRLLELLESNVIRCDELDLRVPRWMIASSKKYADLSPQLADLSLLYLAEREGLRDIFTLDRRDFTVYRTTEDKPFNLLPAR